MKDTTDQRRAYNRVIVLLVLSSFFGAWVLISSGEYQTASFLYIILGGIICPALYLSWNKWG